MTHLIHDRDLDLSDLSKLQQHMVKELAEQINGVCELGQANPEQVETVFRRIVAVLERLREHNRSVAAKPE